MMPPHPALQLFFLICFLILVILAIKEVRKEGLQLLLNLASDPNAWQAIEGEVIYSYHGLRGKGYVELEDLPKGKCRVRLTQKGVRFLRKKGQRVAMSKDLQVAFSRKPMSCQLSAVTRE